jgi:SAM-dependent methyltransferase
MSIEMWDQRYESSELVWSATPNLWIEQLAADLPVGKALDLAAGEGRNTLWLAELGWDATAVDFSSVALDRATKLASDRLGEAASRFHTEQADLLVYAPTDNAFDLVMVVYLQIPAEPRRAILRRAAEAVGPDGLLIVVAHDSTNLEHGVGGPQDPAVLYSAQDVVVDLAGTGLIPERVETGRRPVQTADGLREALDAIVVARRPGTSAS